MMQIWLKYADLRGQIGLKSNFKYRTISKNLFFNLIAVARVNNKIGEM